jgi:hypothetical protein
MLFVGTSVPHAVRDDAAPLVGREGSLLATWRAFSPFDRESVMTFPNSLEKSRIPETWRELERRRGKPHRPSSTSIEINPVKPIPHGWKRRSQAGRCSDKEPVHDRGSEQVSATFHHGSEIDMGREGNQGGPTL